MAAGGRLLLPLLLVDTSTNRILVLRTVSLSTAFTAALATALQEQMRRGPPGATFDETLQRLYQQSSVALAATAPVRCAIEARAR